MIEALERIRHVAWGEDIPNPQTPEYIEHHASIQKILAAIDKEIENEENRANDSK